MRAGSRRGAAGVEAPAGLVQFQPGALLGKQIKPYQIQGGRKHESIIYHQLKRGSGKDHFQRKHGAHSLRASLASSMVNEGIPYEAVRKTLGHSDLNSTKCYARLDLEQLRPYTLSPPEASGFFLEFLMGRRCVE